MINRTSRCEVGPRRLESFCMTTALDTYDLKSRFGGKLLHPNDQGYEAARKVFNAMIDRRPGLIAQCTSPEDVVLVVNFARERRLLLSVRCAGHNVAGFAVCDEGVVIDLSLMKHIAVLFLFLLALPFELREFRLLLSLLFGDSVISLIPRHTDGHNQEYEREDRDLDSIRQDPRFRQLLREYENH